jgi:hypothetical protein
VKEASVPSPEPTLIWLSPHLEDDPAVENELRDEARGASTIFAFDVFHGCLPSRLDTMEVKL